MNPVQRLSEGFREEVTIDLKLKDSEKHPNQMSKGTEYRMGKGTEVLTASHILELSKSTKYEKKSETGETEIYLVGRY